MHERVETVARVGDQRVHRFQVVHERREGESGNGDTEAWIVVGFGDGEVVLADVDFEWTRSVPGEAFRSGGLEPLSAGEVPIWGY